MNSPRRAHLRFRESKHWTEAGAICPHCKGKLYQPRPPHRIPHLWVWCPECREENLGGKTRAENLGETRKQRHAPEPVKQPGFFPDRNTFQTSEEIAQTKNEA